MYGATFSVPEESGIVYNSKGECILFFDMDKASVSIFDEIADFSNVECYRILFGETKIDTFVIENDYISISADKQTVTLKFPLANTPLAVGSTVRLTGALGTTSVADSASVTENCGLAVLLAKVLPKIIPEPTSTAPNTESTTLFFLSISLL